MEKYAYVLTDTNKAIRDARNESTALTVIQVAQVQALVSIANELARLNNKLDNMTSDVGDVGSVVEALRTFAYRAEG